MQISLLMQTITIPVSVHAYITVPAYATATDAEDITTTQLMCTRFNLHPPSIVLPLLVKVNLPLLEINLHGWAIKSWTQ